MSGQSQFFEDLEFKPNSEERWTDYLNLGSNRRQEATDYGREIVKEGKIGFNRADTTTNPVTLAQDCYAVTRIIGSVKFAWEADSKNAHQ